MTAKHVFIIDDDEAIRHSASFMLRLAGYTVATYPDGPSFLEALTPDQKGCILLDVRMPIMDGLTVQQHLTERGSTLPIVVLTGHGDVSVAVQAMKNGAIEFLEKPYEKDTLIDAIETGFQRLDTQDSGERMKIEAKGKIGALTPRESEVLACLVKGMTNKAIAQALTISPRTVEIHRANLMEKMGADSLSAALRIAFHAGLAEDDVPDQE